MKQKLTLALFVIGTVLVTDIATKQWALVTLTDGMTLHKAGGFIPLTLAYNTGIAFGLDVPSAGRWILIGASLFVVAMLGGLFYNARDDDWLRLSSVSLVTAGAVGNLIDRIRWDRGVVDFIGPFDLRFMQWPIFNVADMAITVGAILLGLSLWHEERRPATAPIEAGSNPGLEES